MPACRKRCGASVPCAHSSASASATASILALFQTLNDEGVTVVMNTHDSDVANHAKRILHIRDGRFAEQAAQPETEVTV